jgi:hypothetical protein
VKQFPAFRGVDNMTFDYEEIRTDVVEPLIREFGREGTLLSQGVPTGPVWDPMPGPDIEAPLVVMELLIMDGQVRIIESLRQNTAVQQSDKTMLVSTETGSVPKVGDRFRDSKDDVTYTIIVVSPLNPGNTTLLYKMVIRK